jgi:hypothetical protein
MVCFSSHCTTHRDVRRNFLSPIWTTPEACVEGFIEKSGTANPENAVASPWCVRVLISRRCASVRQLSLAIDHNLLSAAGLCSSQASRFILDNSLL